MKPILAALPCLVFPLAAQVSLPASLSPDSIDLSSQIEAPFMVAAGRVQCFYEARELPSPNLIVNRLLLRYDGPTGGQAKVHTISKLTVSLGVTTRDVSTLGAEFATNLSQALTMVYQKSPYQFVSDGNVGAAPEAFGGPGGQFRLVLPAPVSISVPSGGCLALEIAVEGNDNTGLDAAYLDFHLDPTALLGLGGAGTNGRGCPTPSALGAAQLMTGGMAQPGSPLLIYGDGYPPNVPVGLLLTGAVLTNPLALPATTPICWIYVDLVTGGVLPFGSSNAGGLLDPLSGGGDPLPIPKGPGLCGVKLYVQTASPTPLSGSNQFGVQTSNYRPVQLGCAQTPQAGGWFVGNHRSATSGVGTIALNGALALRIE